MTYDVCTVKQAEILHIFDELKGRSKGYASTEYSHIGYRENNLVKLGIRSGQLATARAARAASGSASSSASADRPL